MSTKGGLDSYSPEYLAEDDSQSLIDASVAVIVVITIVYAMFLISRLFCAEHNHWEFRVLYPFSYLLCLGLCINGICESTEAVISVLCEFLTDLLVLTPALKCLLKSQVRADIWPIG